MTWIALVAGAYLLGSVSFSYLLVKRLRGRDVRTLGSGNAGATNVLRTSGTAAGAAVLALDAGKGALPVLAARLLEAPAPVMGAAGVAAVVGHVFPVYLGFKGGKGVATGAGVHLVFSPLATLLAAVAFVAVVAATGYVALGSVLAALLLPLAAWGVGAAGWAPPLPAPLLVASGVIVGLVVVMHWENLRRLAAGTEGRLRDPEEDVDGEEGAP